MPPISKPIVAILLSSLYALTKPSIITCLNVFKASMVLFVSELIPFDVIANLKISNLFSWILLINSMNNF